jgi:hypothetical protein|tara:strand:+ start:120 stop:542 length:423 start_codon:yes stop_codon:yes gene_type:complete
MSEEEFEGMKDIKNLFREVLGSDVEIKDNIDATEENVFVLFIEKLDKAFILEEKTEALSGLDLTKITEDLWFVIENSFKFLYGEESTQVIFWYVYQRHESKCILEDEEGKKCKIDTPQKLWSYVKNRSYEEDGNDKMPEV